MLHYTFLGHGSLEEGTQPTSCAVPPNTMVIIYSPPGAAMAGNYADEVHEAICRKARIRMYPEGYAALLREHAVLRFRETKGASRELHDNYAVTEHGYPRVFKPGEAVPNYTLTGDGSLRYSGIYEIDKDGSSKRLVKLHSHDTRLLCSMLGTIANVSGSKCVHWLACASDHTVSRPQSSSLWEDMKVSIEYR